MIESIRTKLIVNNLVSSCNNFKWNARDEAYCPRNPGSMAIFSVHLKVESRMMYESSNFQSKSMPVLITGVFA